MYVSLLCWWWFWSWCELCGWEAESPRQSDSPLSKLPKINAISNFWIYLASWILRTTDYEKLSEGLDAEETRCLTLKPCKSEKEGEREWKQQYLSGGGTNKNHFLNLVAKFLQALCWVLLNYLHICYRIHISVWCTVESINVNLVWYVLLPLLYRWDYQRNRKLRNLPKVMLL